MADSRNRSSDAERRRRELEALQLLSQGYGSAYVAQEMSQRYGVSIRTGRRYVSVAALDLVGEMTPHALDMAAGLTLHRLDLIAGESMKQGDHQTAIRASRAHAASLAAFRKAITAPAGTRFRLPDARPADAPSPDDSIPF